MEKLLNKKIMGLPTAKEAARLAKVALEKGRFAAEVFGDSVLRGVIFDENVGGYRMYRGRFSDAMTRFHADLRNNSRFGFTVDRGYALLQKTVTEASHPALVFLEYGNNDCNFDWAKVESAPDSRHDPVTPPEVFTRIYGELVDYVISCGSVPVIVLPPPIDAEKFLTWICRRGLSRERILHWLGSADLIYRWQEYYVGLCEDIAREKGCLTLDLRTPFLTSHAYGELICADGMHPTEKGHAMIDEVFCRFFECVME